VPEGNQESSINPEEVCVIDTTGEAGTEIFVLNHVEYDDTEKHSADEKALDLAAHILNGESNAVKWKIDRHVMPVLFLTEMICSIDKNVISNAPFSHCQERGLMVFGLYRVR
jgi:hypothetical protein